MEAEPMPVTDADGLSRKSMSSAERAHATHRRPRRLLPAVMACALAASITITMQAWIGSATIYSAQVADRRAEMHAYVLHNQLPPGVSWSELGANSSNIRVATVYFAEGVHRATGADVATIYRYLDTLALWASLLLLLVYLKPTTPPTYRVIGLLWFAAMLPLSYQLHYFHPWDRASLLGWLVLLVLLERRRLVAFGVLLPLAVAIKFDIVVLPVLHFLRDATRRTVQRVAAETAALLAVSFGTYALLRALLPGGSSPRHALPQMLQNVRELGAMRLSYPPLLCFGVPAALVLIGWRYADRGERANAVMGAGVAAILFAITNFAEVRAELPVLVLLLPCALVGARRLIEGDAPRESGRAPVALPAAGD